MRAGFRKDIQGLRALAVLLVALDHAQVGPFHGGFIGVDAFFVISGFLITSLLIGEADRDGRVSLSRFYARRARRILPAATVVTIVTIAASVWLLSGVEALAAARDAVWATFFAANIHFAAIGTDYFSADVAPSPMQHYWSLAVEEQFYLVWPLLVLSLTWLAARRSWGVRRTLVPALVLILGGSLAWSVAQTGSDSVSAYFSSTARAWELGLGALVAACALRLASVPAALRAVAGWSGLGAVLLAAVTFDEHTTFPGIAVALPVVGTALLLGSGLGTPAPGPQRLLGIAPMRVVGDWSYSFYLWHWPALVITAAAWRQPAGWSGLAVLAGALALSGLTYAYVENPFRTARAVAHRWRGIALYPATLALVLPVALLAQPTVARLSEHHGPAITAGDVRPGTDPLVALVEASARAALAGAEIPARLTPDPLVLRDAVPGVGECEYFDPEVRHLCPRGAVDADRTIVLLGDSHARQWIPALELIAADRGYTAYFLVREGCPGADVTPWLTNGTGPSLACRAFQEWARQQVEQLRPELVFVASDANEAGFAGPDGARVTALPAQATLLRDGITRQAAALKQHAGRVVVLLDPPSIEPHGSECLSERGSDLGDCMSAPDPRSLTMIEAVRRGARAARVEYVDPVRWFCWRDHCPLVVGDTITMRDREHISSDYAAQLAPGLARRLGLTD